MKLKKQKGPKTGFASVKSGLEKANQLRERKVAEKKQLKVRRAMDKSCLGKNNQSAKGITSPEKEFFDKIIKYLIFKERMIWIKEGFGGSNNSNFL